MGDRLVEDDGHLGHDAAMDALDSAAPDWRAAAVDASIRKVLRRQVGRLAQNDGENTDNEALDDSAWKSLDIDLAALVDNHSVASSDRDDYFARLTPEVSDGPEEDDEWLDLICQSEE
jgi:hypothetical protein